MYPAKYFSLSVFIIFAIFACCWTACQRVPRNQDFPKNPLFLKDEGRNFQFSSHSPREGDAWHIQPGEEKVLAEIQGPAILENMWFTCGDLNSPNSSYLRDLILRIYWDGEESPSVEVPFGDFFGNAFARRTTWASPYLGVTSGGFYSYFPMPFRQNARITLTNKMETPTIVFFHFHGKRYASLPEDTLYFHCQFLRENPTTRGKNFSILQARGEGYFAGSFVHYQAYDRADKKNFLEGDIFMFIDGESTASIKGTGGEDYFQGGWYFIDGPFQTESHGLIVNDPEAMQFSCYRFHLKDRVNFTQDLRVEIEHGNRPNNEARVDMAATAYWYQKEPHQPFPTLPDREPSTVEEAYLFPFALEWEGYPGAMPLYRSTYVQGMSNHMGSIFRIPPGEEVKKTFSMEKGGRYKVAANFARCQQGGKVQVLINGEPVGEPVDLYHEEPFDGYLLNANPETGLIDMGMVELKTGENVMSLKGLEANPDSTGYMVMIDCATLEALEP